MTNSNQQKTLVIKIDVDTDRGTRIGVPNMLRLFAELKIPATFLFALGPDNTGRAIKRIFRPGFLRKVSRSNVIGMYGIRTLLNGVLLPGPHISKRNRSTIYSAYQQGHEVGIHCYDHIRWQDGLMKMSRTEVFTEFAKARDAFQTVFNFPAKSAGAAGWQANAQSLAAYDDAQLLYGSDARGAYPFFPRVGKTIFNTLQIPTNLPTLDELLGRPEYPLEKLTDYYLSILKIDTPNVFTVHAEIEGMQYLDWFKSFLQQALAHNVKILTLQEIAQQLLNTKEKIPVCELIHGEVEGRSGNLALQGLE